MPNINKLEACLFLAILMQATGQIKALMHSPLTSPKGYDGDRYITIERNDGVFCMVQENDDDIYFHHF